MFKNQLEQQDKSIARRIKAAVAAMLPRRATVTRAERNGVWVKFREEEAESWFVSTVAGVPAGTVGWVFTLAGAKGLFVVTGIWHPVPIELWNGSLVNTTSLTTPTMLIDETITLPPGTWQITCDFRAHLWRSVTNGDRGMYIEIDGWGGTLLDPAGNGAPRNQGYFFHRPARQLVVSITEERTVPLRLGVRGGSTAGTTYMGFGSITGHAIRLGEPT